MTQTEETGKKVWAYLEKFREEAALGLLGLQCYGQLKDRRGEELRFPATDFPELVTLSSDIGVSAEELLNWLDETLNDPDFWQEVELVLP